MGGVGWLAWRPLVTGPFTVAGAARHQEWKATREAARETGRLVDSDSDDGDRGDIDGMLVAANGALLKHCVAVLKGERPFKPVVNYQFRVRTANAIGWSEFSEQSAPFQPKRAGPYS